tara:strand:+ start:20028 stop:20393 length:366 start_codon:yes stop_codon:yes gene_type:complete
MKPYIASLINAIVLVIIGLWGYVESNAKAVTALIPVITGVILILINNGVKKENKTSAHIAVLLTFIILLGLIKPLTGAIDKQNNIAVYRVGIMLLTTIYALIKFIQSFIEVRRARKLNNKN